MWFLISALLLAAVLWQQPLLHDGETPLSKSQSTHSPAHSAAGDAQDARELLVIKADAARERLAAMPKSEPAAPAGGDLGLLICSYSWPCGEAIAVASCESRLRPEATNGIAYGLFQIHGIHAARFPDFWSAWTDPAANTSWAYDIWSEQGWRPWDCVPH